MKEDTGSGGGPDERGEIRYNDFEPGFQEQWRSARKLTDEQVDAAFRHGFESRTRFADRPFREVAGYLRESWTASGQTARWDDVADIVCSGYERYKGAGLHYSADLATEALDRFQLRTSGGSVTGGGKLGDESHLGAAEPVTDEGPDETVAREIDTMRGGEGPERHRTDDGETS